MPRRQRNQRVLGGCPPFQGWDLAMWKADAGIGTRFVLLDEVPLSWFHFFYDTKLILSGLPMYAQIALPCTVCSVSNRWDVLCWWGVIWIMIVVQFVHCCDVGSEGLDWLDWDSFREKLQKGPSITRPRRQGWEWISFASNAERERLSIIWSLVVLAITVQ